MTLDYPALAELAGRQLPGALFVTVSGAHLYGFPSADSDIDLRGAYAAPLEALIGLDPPAQTIERKLELSGREVELVAHEAGKYFRLMCKHNGYVLEQVFSPLVVAGREFLERFRPLAARCATRGCHHHYRGFLRSRRELLDREPVKKAKTLLYAYRVALSGVHLARTGRVVSDLRELNADFGLPFIDELIRRKADREFGTLGDIDWGFHRAELDRWEERLDAAFAESTLAEEPPRGEMNRFLIELRRAG